MDYVSTAYLFSNIETLPRNENIIPAPVNIIIKMSKNGCIVPTKEAHGYRGFTTRLLRNMAWFSPESSWHVVNFISWTGWNFSPLPPPLQHTYNLPSLEGREPTRKASCHGVALSRLMDGKRAKL